MAKPYESLIQSAWRKGVIVPLSRARERLLDEGFPLEEAKAKLPDPAEMVPIYHWTKKAVWAYVQTPAGPLQVKIPHKLIKKNYADKLVVPPGDVQWLGKIHPATYAGVKHIYPPDWVPAMGKPKDPPDPEEHHKQATKKPTPHADPDIPDTHAVDLLPMDAPAHWDPEGDPEPDGRQWGLFFGSEAWMAPDGSHIYRDKTFAPHNSEVLWGKHPDVAAKTLNTPAADAVAKTQAQQVPKAVPKKVAKPQPKLTDFDIPDQFTPTVLHPLTGGNPLQSEVWWKGKWGAHEYACLLFYHSIDAWIELTGASSPILWHQSDGLTQAGKDYAGIKDEPEEPKRAIKWSVYNLPPGLDSHESMTKHHTYALKKVTSEFVAHPEISTASIFLLPSIGRIAEYESMTGAYHPLVQDDYGLWEVDGDAAPVSSKDLIAASSTPAWTPGEMDTMFPLLAGMPWHEADAALVSVFAQNKYSIELTMAVGQINAGKQISAIKTIRDAAVAAGLPVPQISKSKKLMTLIAAHIGKSNPLLQAVDAMADALGTADDPEEEPNPEYMKGVELPSGWTTIPAEDENGYGMISSMTGAWHSPDGEDEMSALPHEFGAVGAVSGTRYGYWDYAGAQSSYIMCYLVSGGGATLAGLQVSLFDINAKDAGNSEEPLYPKPPTGGGTSEYWNKGSLDSNGLQWWQSKADNTWLVVLPNGAYAKWSKKHFKYFAQKEDPNEPGSFPFVYPALAGGTTTWTLEEVLAMKHAPVTPSAWQQASADGWITNIKDGGIPEAWQDGGTDVATGFKDHYTHTADAAWYLTELPDGRLAAAMSGVYKLAKWKSSGQVKFTGEELTDGQVASIGTAHSHEHMHPDVKIPTGWTLLDEKDPNGLLQINLFKPDGTAKYSKIPRSILPAYQDKGIYGRFKKAAKGGMVYRLYKITSKGVMTPMGMKGAAQHCTLAMAKAVASVGSDKPSMAGSKILDLSVFGSGSLTYTGDIDTHGLPLLQGPELPPNKYVPLSVMPDQIGYQKPSGDYVIFQWSVSTQWDNEVAKVSAKLAVDMAASIGVGTGSAVKAQDPSVPDEDIHIPKPKATKAAELAPIGLLADLAGKLPDASQLTVVDAGQGLKGAGAKYRCKDHAGNEYLFKPAWPKGGKNPEGFRAYSQQVNAAILGTIRDHIPLTTMKLDLPGQKNVFGTIQPLLELGDPPDLAGQTPEDLTTQELHDVITDHVADWITSQHDTHKANLIRTKDGRILSIDKEQGFKHFGKDKLSSTYHPPGNPDPPFYNAVWQAFEEGKVDFDPMVLKGAFDKIHASSFSDLEPALRNYANSAQFLMGEPVTEEYQREEFVSRVQSRRNTAKRDFEKLITEKYLKRTGAEGEFTFAKGWVEKGGKKFKTITYDLTDIANNEHGQDSAKKTVNVRLDSGLDVVVMIRNHSKSHGAVEDDPELVVFKVSQGVGLENLKAVAAKFGVRSVGEPVQGSANVMIYVRRADLKKVGSVSDEVEITEASSKATEPHPGHAEYLPVVDVFRKADPNFKDVVSAHTDKDMGLNGKKWLFDGAYITGHSAFYRRVKQGSTSFIQVGFRINRKKLPSMHLSGNTGLYRSLAGSYSKQHDAFDQTGSSEAINEGYMTGKQTKLGTDLIHVCEGGKYAMTGFTFCEIHGSDMLGALEKLLAAAFDEKIAAKMLKPATEQDQRLIAARRLLSAYQPQVHDEFGASQTAAVLAAIKEHGLEDKLDKVRSVEGLPGHVVHTLPGRWKEAKNKDGEPILKFVVHGVKHANAIPHILKNGLVGGVGRSLLGTTKTGSCNDTDWTSGGADTAGVRLVTDKKVKANKTFADLGGVGAGSAVQLIYSPDVVDRLDAVSHDCDSYQVSGPHSGNKSQWVNREPMKARIESINSGGNNGQETIMVRGLHSNKLLRVVCSSEGKRKEVISECFAEGVKEWNGVPIEDFIVAGPFSFKPVYENYVKAAGF